MGRLRVRDNRVNPKGENQDILDRIIRRTLRQDETAYSVVRGSLFNNQTRLHDNVYGDTLCIHEAPTSILQIRIGDVANPWIRFREGDVFTRPFQRFWVRCIQENIGVAGTADYVIYSSFGPVINRVQPPRGGIKAEFWIPPPAVITAKTSLISIIGLGSYKFTLGKDGGTIAILNDIASDSRLLVRYGGAFDGQGWPLAVGQSMEMDLRGRLQITTGDQQLYFEPETLGGSCTVVVMLDVEIDQSDFYAVPDKTLVGG